MSEQELYLVVHHAGKSDEEVYVVLADSGPDAWLQVNKCQKINRGAMVVPLRVQEGEVMALRFGLCGWFDLSK